MRPQPESNRYLPLLFPKFQRRLLYQLSYAGCGVIPRGCMKKSAFSRTIASLCVTACPHHGGCTFIRFGVHHSAPFPALGRRVITSTAFAALGRRCMPHAVQPTASASFPRCQCPLCLLSVGTGGTSRTAPPGLYPPPGRALAQCLARSVRHVGKLLQHPQQRHVGVAQRVAADLQCLNLRHQRGDLHVGGNIAPASSRRELFVGESAVDSR